MCDINMVVGLFIKTKLTSINDFVMENFSPVKFLPLLPQYLRDFDHTNCFINII